MCIHKNKEVSLEEDEFSHLERKFNDLKAKKLGFPTSFMASQSLFVDNSLLGIRAQSLSSFLINGVGDPFKKSETWSMEVKEFEIKLIRALSHYFGLPKDQGRGYVTSGGTEANEACLRWTKMWFKTQLTDKLKQAQLLKNKYQSDLEVFLEELIQYSKLNESKLTDDENNLKYNNKNLNQIKELYYKIKIQTEIIEEITKPTLFCSEDTHYSIFKIANALNVNVIRVPATEAGAMDLNTFKTMILQHAKSFPNNPIIVSANIGTTKKGAVDDVPAIKEIMQLACSLYSIHMDGALLGIVLPILKPFGQMKNYFQCANTMSLSFHKYLGVPQPTGLALTPNHFLKAAYLDQNNTVEYAGNIEDITVSGSRSGLNILLVYHAVINGLALDKSNKKIEQLVARDLNMACFFYDELVKVLGKKNVFYNPNQFNILIPKPRVEIIKKYQLMINKNQAIIFVLNNVDKALIQEFIKDLTSTGDINNGN